VLSLLRNEPGFTKGWSVRRTFVAATIRLYYDLTVAVALMTVTAMVCGLIAAVITNASTPNFPVATIAFLLTGDFMFLLHRRSLRTLAHDR
jgi:hypothetical protein